MDNEDEAIAPAQDAGGQFQFNAKASENAKFDL